MILKDFKKPNGQRFSEINKILKSRFGVTISESLNSSEIQRLRMSFLSEMHDLRMDGHVPGNSEELDRYMLMKDALDTHPNFETQAPMDPVAKYQERIISKILDDLVAHAYDLVTCGENYHDAIKQTMNIYKKSPWLYDESRIQEKLENCLNDKITTLSVQESTMKRKPNNTKLRESLENLFESELEEAEVVIATKGFSKSLQEMIEKVGRLQNEDLPPLADQLRNIYGVETAQQFHEKTQSTLQSVLDALYYSREEIDREVQNMAKGIFQFDVDMDKDISSAPDNTMGREFGADDDLDELEAELDLSDADAGEPLGRVRKESIQHVATKLKYLQEQLAVIKNKRAVK